MVNNKKSHKKRFKKRILGYAVTTFARLFMASIMLTLPLRWLNPCTSTCISQEMFADIIENHPDSDYAEFVKAELDKIEDQN